MPFYFQVAEERFASFFAGDDDDGEDDKMSSDVSSNVSHKKKKKKKKRKRRSCDDDDTAAAFQPSPMKKAKTDPLATADEPLTEKPKVSKVCFVTDFFCNTCTTKL